ncbi:MAG TPA: HEAT repeat domain-containing protein, partial [Planctomycetota bacterium]|nr:HEAT repeat domain-containing protein [Planctomycetota bacterium]
MPCHARRSLTLAILSLWLPLANAAEEGEGDGAAGKPSKVSEGKGKLTVSEVAPTGTVGSVVGITSRPDGRLYLTNTNRRANGAIDIRKVPEWLMESLACTSIEDKRALIHRKLSDWKKLETFKEKIYAIDVSDSDGKMTKSAVAFEGFGTDINGVAAGVLWYDNALFVTSYPSLYKLTDPDGDGVFDQQEELVTGMGIHVGYGGHDMHGPTLGLDGRIYWSQGDKGFNITKDGKHYYGPGLGAVYRIDPDGSHFEVYCTGVRNPFDLAFDGHGNLFTVDNDGDFPTEREGIRFLLDGGDGGWRAHWQYREGKRWPELNAYNPWMADGLWKPPFAEQPAYVTSPFVSYSDGPIGLEWEPGTALNDRYRGYFFLAESPKKITSFRLEKTGAGFVQKDAHVVLAGPFYIGISFGADGALYAADWGDNEWMPHEKGRVLKLDDPMHAKDTVRREMQKQLRSDFSKRSDDDLTALLSHADQRVRLQAQLALAKRGDTGRTHFATVATNAANAKATQYARLHAVWGLGQLARGGDGAAGDVLTRLLGDTDAEVRAQAAKDLGEANVTSAADAVAKALTDPAPRVRLFAGIALGRIGAPAQLSAAVALLTENDNHDVYLRHAGVMALIGCVRQDHAPLVALKSNASRSVRLAAVVALRHMGDAQVAQFLSDTDAAVVGEAARAIHDDLSIAAALPALAALLDKDGLTDEPTVRRAISANLMQGDAVAAKRLITFAQRKVAGELRAEALDALAAFLKPLVLDRVQGVYRGLPARDHALVVDAAAPALETLLFGKSKAVQAATARLIAVLGLPEWSDRLTTLANDTSKDAALRVVALGALEAMGAKGLDAAVKQALGDADADLRGAALEVMAHAHPADDATYAALDYALSGSVLADRQRAIAVLGTMKHKRAVAKLGELLATWKDGKLDAAVRLDVAEAVRAGADKNHTATLKDIEKQVAKSDPRGLVILALEGGDPMEGERTFKTSTTASCTQCHVFAPGTPPTVGPNLSGVGTRLDRSHLLTALVTPNAEIAQGFGVVNLTLTDGSVLSGALASESDSEVTLRPVGAPEIKIAKSRIKTRSAPVSIMPPMGTNLSPHEMRNV